MSDLRWRPSRRDSRLIEYGTIEKVSREMGIGDACERLNDIEAECARYKAALEDMAKNQDYYGLRAWHFARAALQMDISP